MKAARRGLSNGVTVVLVVAALLVGLLGSFVFTSSQNRAVTTTETRVSSTTETQTQVSTIARTQVNTQTQFETTTQIQTHTSISTSTRYLTNTTTFYPIPSNVTVYLNISSGQIINFEINTTSYLAEGSAGSPESYPVTPAYVGQTITVSIHMAVCSGPIGTAEGSLYINGVTVASSEVECGGTTSAQFSYIL